MIYQKDIFDYLNNIGTIIIAICTFVYVITTILIYKYSKKTLSEQLRPYIVIDMLSEDLCIYLRIRNTGNREAKNVKIIPEPSLDEILASDDSGRTKWIEIEPILEHSSFTPGYEIKFFINWSQKFLEIRKKDKNYIYNITVNYIDDHYKDYSGKFNINLDRIVYDKKAALFSTNYYIENIDKKLEKLNEIIESKLK